MRDVVTIKRDIEALQQEIRYAIAEGDTEQQMEILYNDMSELTNELYEVRAYESMLRNVSALQV